MSCHREPWLGRTDDADDNINGGNSQTLGYDTLNRLTSASGAYVSQGYQYDLDGNRSLETLGSTTITYTLDTGDNRLASLSGAQTASYSYDSNGNLLGDGAHSYGFDDTNRLGSVDSGTTASYAYNGLGQRVEKTVGSTPSLFLYDEGGHLLGEYDSSGNLVQEHIWLGERPVAVQTAAGLDYVHTDQLGTPRAVTDFSKTVEWSWGSDPFGNGQPTGSLTYNLRFPGQYYDAETGHNYNLNRDYDIGTGRYIESDPIGLAGGINTYVYASENPITRYDLRGLYWQYFVNTGNLYYVDNSGFRNPTPVGSGYSGNFGGLNPDNPQNNPNDENQPYRGPIPAGGYTINPCVTSSSMGPVACSLTPDPTNNMHGRTGFWIHGGNGITTTQSDGCIILPRNVRQIINNSDDRRLEVFDWEL